MSDSELLVKQMRGEYKVKNEGLKPLHAEARAKAAHFSRFSIRHVERKQNATRRCPRQPRAGRTAEGWSIIQQPRGSGRM